MTCNDCIYAQVCGYRDQLDINPVYYAEQCEDFKDKSRFIEIPSKRVGNTIKKRSSIMREILFRGKRVDNGEWVSGYYVRINGKEHRIYTGYAETDCGESFPDYYMVDADTIGQGTNIADKNGIQICEGDILITHGETLVVKHNDWTGHINAVDKNDVTYPFLSDMVVIGNIYDNADLLEGFK